MKYDKKQLQAEALKQHGKNISYLKAEIYKAEKRGHFEVVEGLEADLFEEEYQFNEAFWRPC